MRAVVMVLVMMVLSDDVLGLSPFDVSHVTRCVYIFLLWSKV